MSRDLLVPGISLLVVLVSMVAELRVSHANERTLRRDGAIEPPDEGYATMRWSYPIAFVAMAVEGLARGAPSPAFVLTGAMVFVLAKALKYWAIRSLGRFWTFKVLVLPDEPLVQHGPYAFMRHPNYVGVIGELAGMALLVGAVVTGPLSVVGFGWLVWRRIEIEERALELR